MAGERERCEYRGCRRQVRYVMMLFRIDYADRDDHVGDSTPVHEALLCEEHMRTMGYDASFPGDTDGG